jgi:hypothetical protein
MIRAPMIVVAVVAAARCLVGAASCSNTGGTPAGGGSAASSTPAAFGTPAASSTPARAGPVAIGVLMKATSGDSVTTTAFTPNYSSADQFSTPSAGQQCIQVTVAVNNGSQSEWLLPLSELSVVDASGQKYDSFAIDCGSGDSIDALVAGGHATAKLVFEVPANTPLNLTWVPNQFLSEVYQTKLR